jgi:hypothetical protein
LELQLEHPYFSLEFVKNSHIAMMVLVFLDHTKDNLQNQKELITIHFFLVQLVTNVNMCLLQAQYSQVC